MPHSFPLFVGLNQRNGISISKMTNRKVAILPNLIANHGLTHSILSLRSWSKERLKGFERLYAITLPMISIEKSKTSANHNSQINCQPSGLNTNRRVLATDWSRFMIFPRPAPPPPPRLSSKSLSTTENNSWALKGLVR